MDPSLRRFIDRLAMMFSQEGLPKAAALILGYLFVSDGPRSLEDMTRDLRISKATASLNTRLFEQIGLVERHPSADRKVYFAVAPDPWERIMAKKMAAMDVIAKLARDTVRDASHLAPVVEARLREMDDFYSFWGRELPRLMEKRREQNVIDRPAEPGER